MKKNIKDILLADWLGEIEEEIQEGRTTVSDLALSLLGTQKKEAFEDIWGWLVGKSKITPQFINDVAFTLTRMYDAKLNNVNWSTRLEDQERSVPAWKENVLIRCLPFLDKNDHNNLFFDLFQHAYASPDLSRALEANSVLTEQGKNAALLVSRRLTPTAVFHSPEHSESLLKLSENVLKTNQRKFKHTLRANSLARLENRDPFLEAAVNTGKCYESFLLWMKYTDTDLIRVLTGAINAKDHQKHKSGRELARQLFRSLSKWPEKGQVWLEDYFRGQGPRLDALTESFRETGFERGILPLVRKIYSLSSITMDDLQPWAHSFCSWAASGLELNGVLAVSRWDAAIMGYSPKESIVHQVACLDACEKALASSLIGLSEEQEAFLNNAREWRMRSQLIAPQSRQKSKV